MKAGSGKRKGSAFERQCCKLLSLWITNGKKEDVFWRSSLSGGRATVAKKAGRDVRQAGDICAVAPEGHALTDHYYLECKSYRNLDIDSFILDGKGKLAKFWLETVKQAGKYQRAPILIAKENGRKSLVLFSGPSLNTTGFFVEDRITLYRQAYVNCYIVYLDDALKGKFKVGM